MSKTVTTILKFYGNPDASYIVNDKQLQLVDSAQNATQEAGRFRPEGESWTFDKIVGAEVGLPAFYHEYYSGCIDQVIAGQSMLTFGYGASGSGKVIFCLFINLR